jgi:hypothetical protein
MLPLRAVSFLVSALFVAPLTVGQEQPWFETGLLLPELGQDFQEFGAAVALDGTTALVGAPGAWGPIGGSFGAGSAHVFVLQGTDWVHEQELDTPAIFTAAGFGAAVDVDGDTAVIGMPGLQQGGFDYQGGVAVFVRSGGTWTFETSLLAPDIQPDPQRFGSAVALDGDTLVIGSPEADDNTASGAGAVYVFVRNAGVWSQEARLVSPQPQLDAAFGQDLDVEGDTLIVGEPLATPQPHLTNSGAARMFERVGTTWSFDQTLLSFDVGAWDGAGTVALSGDRAALGAPGFLGPGEVTTYIRQGGTWVEDEWIFDLVWNGKGRSVDLDGDTVVTGTRAFIGEGQRPGALTFDLGVGGAQWNPVAWARDGNTGTGTTLQSPIFALEGDVMLMGNPLHNGAAENAGLVHVFTRGSAWTDLQNGLDGGGFPDPLMYAAGSLASPSDNVLLLAGNTTGGDAYVLASAVNLTVPFKGGVLVPAPDVIVGPLALGLSVGETADLAFHMPPGLPSGVTIYTQAWFADAGAPNGFAATNALSGTIP